MINHKSFTLIELLVVIAIIGILSALSLSSLSEARVRARDARRLSDLKTLNEAFELYFSDSGHYPIWTTGGKLSDSSLTTAVAQYFGERKVPNDPLAKQGKEYYYQSDAGGTNFLLVTALEKDPSPTTVDCANPDLQNYPKLYERCGIRWKPGSIITSQVTQATGGTGGAPPPPGDTTPPTVSSTIPINAATGITLNSSVTINFSENIDCITVTTAFVTISPSVAWSKTSCSGSQAVFTPSGQTNSTTYTVTATTGVKDLVGNQMSANYSFSYTTEAVLIAVSYYDKTNGNLKMIKCGNDACSSGNIITIVDELGDVGQYNSIKIGNDGLPIIAYSDTTNSKIKIVKCGNTTCSVNNIITTITTIGIAEISLTVAPDGLPIISSQDQGGGLRVVKCGNSACSSGNTITQVDIQSNRGHYSSITINSDGLPVVAYSEDNELIVAKCGNSACSSGNTISIAAVIQKAAVGYDPSIAIGTDGLPIIAHFNWWGPSFPTMVTKCGNISCSADNVTSQVNNNAGSPSIAIGTDGLPIISMVGNIGLTSNEDLDVVKCGNISCSSGNLKTVVDSQDLVGHSPSLTIDLNGLPIISYYDFTNTNLKIVKCGNSACSSGNIITTVDSVGDIGERSSIAIKGD